MSRLVNSCLWQQTWWLMVIVLTCWIHVFSFHRLIFEFILIVGCEYHAWNLGSSECGKRVQCPCYSPVFCLPQTSCLPRTQCLRSVSRRNSKGPTSHADTPIRVCRSCTGIGFQVHHWQRRICKSTRSWLSPPSFRIQWHGVCRPKQHPISFSDSTIGCFCRASSATQCCATRYVNASYISHFSLYLIENNPKMLSED